MSRSKMMRATFREISHREATRIIRDHNPHNRDSTLNTIMRYATDMSNGNWVRTHQAIAFDENGDLIDGAHRLRAQIVSKTNQTYLVVTGVTREAQFFIDGGRPRNAVDILKLEGMSEINSSMVATARVMMSSPQAEMTGFNTDKVGLREFVRKNMEAIAFAAQCMKSKRKFLTVAPVYAVLARAFYCTSKHALLVRAGEVLLEGIISNPGEQSLIKFRNWLLEGKGSHRDSGQKFNNLCYQKGQAALRAYLKGESLSKIYGVTEDVFPLPEDKKVEMKTRSKSDFTAAKAALVAS